jgi:hypothetical protein
MWEETKLVEVARSYGCTIQPKQFEPVKFFCSMKAEVSPEDIEKTSKELHKKCKKAVEKSVKEYWKEIKSVPLTQSEEIQHKADELKAESIKEENI